MTIEKFHGYYIISDIINGQLVVRKYLYYTKNQAIASFKHFTKTPLENNKKEFNFISL